MLSFNRVDHNVVANNIRYTVECKDLYDNLHFAKITKVSLWNDALYYICGFCALFIFVALGSYVIPSFFRDIRSMVADIVIIGCFIVIPACVIIIYSALCKRSYDKKTEFYFIKTSEGDYKLEATDVEGKLCLKKIAFIEKRKGISVEEDTCNIYRWWGKGGLAEDIGFYQYIVKAMRVFPAANINCTSRLLYKKKITSKSKVYYKFPEFGGVVGAKYGRCIKLEDGVIKYITVQNTSGRRIVGSGFSHGSSYCSYVYDSYKYTYDFVNNDNVKIYIPKRVVEYAEKNKLSLPTNCENLVYEE